MAADLGPVSSKVVQRFFVVKSLYSHYFTLGLRSSYNENCLMKLASGATLFANIPFRGCNHVRHKWIKLFNFQELQKVLFFNFASLAVIIGDLWNLYFSRKPTMGRFGNFHVKSLLSTFLSHLL